MAEILNTNVDATYYDLSQLDFSVGTHTLVFVSRADGYVDADPSNSITVNVWGINLTLTHCSADITPTKVYQGQTKTITITPDEDYKTPEEEDVVVPTGVIYNKVDDSSATLSFNGSLMEASATVSITCVIASEQLDPPTDVTLTGTVLSWTGVDNAETYEIKTQDETIVVVDSNITSYDLANEALDPGTYYLSVRAVGDGVRWLPSEWAGEEEYIVAQKLDYPDNIEITGDIVSWDAVEHNSGYEIKLDDEDPVEVSTTSYDLTQLSPAIGEHTVYVRTIGAAPYYETSDWSEGTEYVVLEQLNAPVNVAVYGTKAIFTPSENAEDYHFYDEGGNLIGDTSS